MTRLEALKHAFTIDESTLLSLHRQPPEVQAQHCPDQPEAFRDGVELRFRMIMVMCAEMSEFKNDVRDYDAFVDRINAKYGSGTAIKYSSSGDWGLGS